MFEDKWPSMRPIILKLLQQEPVTQNEWQDLFYSVHLVCLWDEKGPPKVKDALRDDIMDFIQRAQAVSFVIQSLSPQPQHGITCLVQALGFITL